ncbi:MAG: glutamate 5-kinase, partial [Sedimentisphaerales bacterium]|nr:glutamate 5-kinase [Sedimentisphaerales bacterium]
MRNFINTKRIVIKVGTNVLSKKGRVDTEFLQIIAGQIAELIQQQKQVILVTSGAIGMGIGALGIRKQVTEVKMRQACAAVGQGILMHEYQEAFSKNGQKVAQVLLTNSIMSNRKYYVNLKNSVETLLSMSVVPIVNENDCVSIDEIDLAFGDNDRLSAMVASKIDAELLIMLTDVDGLYDKNPRTNQKAKL